MKCLVPETKRRLRRFCRREPAARHLRTRPFRFRGTVAGRWRRGLGDRRRWFGRTGAATGLLAMFVLLGGHWMVLQSIAWSRMLATFARHDSLAAAVSKTFDGQHPCAMCRHIEQGRQQEQQEEQRRPLRPAERMPELLLGPAKTVAPVPPARPVPVLATCPTLNAQCAFAPPKPPPRRPRVTAA